mgnify:CR=1 FL=1
MLIRADNQPIDTRFGDATWITDFITPNNPDVILKYQELTEGLTNPDDIIIAIWQYVAMKPYVTLVASKLLVGGKVLVQEDTWFFPAEAMKVGALNCANKAFLLTSLLKNYMLKPGDVYCVVGDLTLGDVGSHAWVEVRRGGRLYIMETTQPNIRYALIPKELAKAYEAKLYFDEKTVYTVDNRVNIVEVLQADFALDPIQYLETYLCERCLELEGS